MYLYGRASTGKTSLILEMMKIKRVRHAYINCIEYLDKIENSFISIQTQLISGDEYLKKTDLVVDILEFFEWIKSFYSFDDTLYLIFDNIEKWKGVKNYLNTLVKIDQIVKLK